MKENPVYNSPDEPRGVSLGQRITQLRSLMAHPAWEREVISLLKRKIDEAVTALQADLPEKETQCLRVQIRTWRELLSHHVVSLGHLERTATEKTP
ncbi:MAG: hypothetical protein RL088_4257 [Verrucomicrobiota bacterium]|jgi:hypothetical protein